MKKTLSLILAALMLLSVLALAGCNSAQSGDSGKSDGDNLKFGMGIYAVVEKATSAQDDTDGSGEMAVTAAAVLVDADGKIVKCVLDTAANNVKFTADGKAVEAGEFKTKYEMGDAYGMVAYGNAKSEWYKQADIFASVVVGKTADEVKALVADGDKGTDEVVNAGCTIMISDFAKAIDKALSNAASSKATKNDTLKLGFVSVQSALKDATDDADGSNEVTTTIVATAINNNKVVVASTDAVTANFTFNNKGITTVDSETVLTTKKEAGANYGMAQYGNDLNKDGEVKEWVDQAAIFDAECVGKTADEITALALDTGYGVDALQSAGCTINVADFVKAAVKAASAD